MQTTAKRRQIVPIQVRRVALAVAIAIGVTGAGTAAVSLAEDSSSDVELERVDRPVGAEHPMFDYQFMEQNFHLPVAPEPTVTSSTAPNWRVLEENSWGEDFVFDTPDGYSYYPSVDDVPQRRVGQVTY